MSGKELLLNDLNSKPDSPERTKIIRQVQRGIYSDFATPLAAPAMALIESLQTLKYDDMVKKAYTGAYDHDE